MIYQWGERRFAVHTVVAPREVLEVDLSAQPGGEECRLVVEYSNGQRSAGAATRKFSLPPLGPALAIITPAKGTVLGPGQALQLQGQVLDPERPGGARPAEELTWSVDGEPAGRGPVGGLDWLTEGRHRVILRYQSPAGVTERNTIVSMVRDPHAPRPADEWEPWDYFPEEPTIY